MEISFEKIKSYFPSEHWDLGVLSAEQLKQASLHPIKYKFHPTGIDYTNDIHFNGLVNTVVLMRQGHTWDYTHYEQAEKILEDNKVENCFLLYTNFKEAAILAGVGVRARNSLVYSYKFGFDCHIAAVGFTDTIVDIPKNKRINTKLWPRCKNCYDCVNACPVQAIHAREKPFWIDSSACDSFIGKSDHPTIPSIKKFWHENVYPELSKQEADRVAEKGNLPWDKNGYSFDGYVVKKDGVAVNVPFCRECTSQPRCSKWNGKYPYEEMKTCI
jgi:ferredoxin